MHSTSRHQRFVLRARRNNPLINSLGEFAIWTLHTARSHRNVSVAFGAAVAALVVCGFQVSSTPVATVLWLLAALLAASSLLVAVIGFVAQQGANETELRLAELEGQLREQESTNRENGTRWRAELEGQLREQESTNRENGTRWRAELEGQLREQESTNRENGTRWRAELTARIDASESRLINDVQDLIVRMLELKSEFTKNLEKSDAPRSQPSEGDVRPTPGGDPRG